MTKTYIFVQSNNVFGNLKLIVAMRYYMVYNQNNELVPATNRN